MDIRIDSGRASSEGWRIASNTPAESLPRLGPEDEADAARLRMSLVAYAQYLYAVDWTMKELGQRAKKVGLYIERWLEDHAIEGSVESISLDTLHGKYRINVDVGGERTSILTDEDLIDSMYERGSAKAEREFRRVLRLNLKMLEAARAS